jgi:hypothetical protein
MKAEPKVLVVWGQYPRWIPPVFFSRNQTTLVARLKDDLPDQSSHNFSYFEDFEPDGWLEMGPFDLREYCESHGLATDYDFVLVFAEQDMGVLPFNTKGFGCPTVLLVGDTHHFPHPISTLIEYAARERFDAIVTQFAGHHTHWFLDAGFRQCAFIPGLVTRPIPLPFHESRSDVVAFIGHHWGYAHVRARRLERLKDSGVPCDIRIGTQDEAANAFATSLISFNCSMNGDINIRNFEVLGAGGFLLTDALPGVTGFAQMFQPGEACDVYASEEEMLSKVAFYRSNPEAAIRIARNGTGLFRATLAPEIALSTFKRLVFEQAEFSSHLPPDPRCRHPVGNHLAARLAAYETIQELHRTQLTVRVLADPSSAAYVASDLIDLAHLEIGLLEGSQAVASNEAMAGVGGWDYQIT